MRCVAIYGSFLLCFAFLSGLQAQDAQWREYVEQLAEEGEINETAIENIYQELLQLENNPLNLNTVTREQLERIPLLSMEEIASIATFLGEKPTPLYRLRVAERSLSRCEDRSADSPVLLCRGQRSAGGLNDPFKHAAGWTTGGAVSSRQTVTPRAGYR